MRSIRLLFLALSRKGWGETSLGVEVAKQVVDMGGSASFLAHSGGMPALAGSGFKVEEVPDHMGPLVELLIGHKILTGDFDAIVLSDFFTTNYTMSHWGLNPEKVLDLPLPVVAIDTWQYGTTGSKVDIFGSTEWAMGTWIGRLALRMVPVPIGHPTANGAYRSVPGVLKSPRHVRAHVRDNMGFSDKHQVVLFCTAGWQHSQQEPNARRIADALPQLLYDYLSVLGPAVQLVHVGPEKLSLGSSERYHWMAQMAPANFDRLLYSADLFLSTNISATTIARAMALSVPVLVVQNPHTVANAEELPLSPKVRAWLQRAAPLYPFAMWPVGYWHFLAPLLRDNPYARAVETVDMLDETGFVAACHELLFDRVRRTTSIGRQHAFLDVARQLPSAAELIGTFLS